MCSQDFMLGHVSNYGASKKSAVANSYKQQMSKLKAASHTLRLQRENATAMERAGLMAEATHQVRRRSCPMVHDRLAVGS